MKNKVPVKDWSLSPEFIAIGRRQRAEGRREKLDGSWFQYLALS
jgi:hypothetical protein